MLLSLVAEKVRYRNTEGFTESSDFYICNWSSPSLNLRYGRAVDVNAEGLKPSGKVLLCYPLP